MTYLNNYEFDIAINDTKADLDPAVYSFIISESIHSLFPTIKINYKDITGIVQESQLIVEGLKLSLSYGIKNIFSNSCNYNNVTEELQTTFDKVSISGEVLVSGVHEYYNKLKIESKGYSGKISDVIKLLFSDYTFKSSTYNDTGSDRNWYRPLLNQQEFLEEILLPNCYSTTSKDSPFFCFITTNNDFNLRNYDSMITNSTKKVLRYAQVVPSNVERTVFPIYEIRRVTTGSGVTKNLRSRDIYSRDIKTGNIDTDSDTIKDYPQNIGGNIPIINDNNKTGILDLIYSEAEVGAKESFLGRKISSQKDGLFLEKWILDTILIPDVHCGDMVELQLPMRDVQKNGSQSQYYSGNYLIEDCNHIWNGKTKSGHTQLIVSRKFVTIPNNFYTKSKYI